MLFVLLILYSVALWKLGSFAQVPSVSVWLGGQMFPHGLRVVRSKACFPVGVIFYLFFIGLEIAPRYLQEYEWSGILPGIGMIILFYFIICCLLLFRTCADQDVKDALDTIVHPPVAYLESDYPSSLIAMESEARLLQALKNPRVAGSAESTPFPAMREIPAELVSQAREGQPNLWVQPLHPMIGQAIAKYVHDLAETAHRQAEKSIDALKKATEAELKIEQLNVTLADLQQSNETLNTKLLSMRTRSRGASGVDFAKMSVEELDAERARMMDTIRRLDEERRKKSA